MPPPSAIPDPDSSPRPDRDGENIQPDSSDAPGRLARQAHWEARYRDGQTGWDRGDPSPALHRWPVLSTWLKRKRSSPGPNPGTLLGRILVPGCGRGHEIPLLARAGFEVVAVDIAAAPLAALRSRLDAEIASRVAIHQADLLDWRPPQPFQPFDAIYEQTSLCALDPHHWDGYVKNLHAWLKPGGALFALFMQTNRPSGPPFHCDLPVMRALFPPQRWRWESDQPQRFDHPSGLHELGFQLNRLPDPAPPAPGAES